MERLGTGAMSFEEGYYNAKPLNWLAVLKYDRARILKTGQGDGG
jgi:hypothetical protein